MSSQNLMSQLLARIFLQHVVVSRMRFFNFGTFTLGSQPPPSWGHPPSLVLTRGDLVWTKSKRHSGMTARVHSASLSSAGPGRSEAATPRD